MSVLYNLWLFPKLEYRKIAMFQLYNHFDTGELQTKVKALENLVAHKSKKNVSLLPCHKKSTKQMVNKSTEYISASCHIRG